MLVRKDVNELCSNTTRVLDYISVCTDSIKNTMPSVDSLNKAAQHRTDVNANMKGGSALLNKINLWFFKVSDRFTTQELTLVLSSPEHS